MNLCINCTHLYRMPRGDLFCTRDSIPSPVDGTPTAPIYLCIGDRSNEGECGPEGRFFELTGGKFANAVRKTFKGIGCTIERRPEMIDGGVGGTVCHGGAHESPDQLGMAFREAVSKLTVDFIDRLAQQRPGGLPGLPKDSIVE